MIRSITILTDGGNRTYTVGDTISGRVLHKILDDTRENDEFFTPVYAGQTEDKKPIFEVVNASTIIEYAPEGYVQPGPPEEPNPHTKSRIIREGR